jgi:seryl-tRNA synthetase
MLDLGYVREHLDVIEKMARDRGVTLDLGAFRELDAERRQIITSIERLKAERNKASEEIARLGKIVHDGDKAKAQIKEHPAGHEETLAAAMAERDALLAKMKTVSDEIKRGDERITELDERMKQFLLTIPNIPHASVPVGKSAADNVEVRRWGSPPKFDFAPKPHWEIGEGAGILDFEAAIKIAG